MVRHFDDLTKEVTAHYDLMVLLERIKIKLNYNIRYVSQRNSIIFFFFFFSNYLFITCNQIFVISKRKL